jgi:hypothetical protein
VLDAIPDELVPKDVAAETGLAFRDYAQAADELGYPRILAYEHVVGASYPRTLFESRCTAHNRVTLFAR